MYGIKDNKCFAQIPGVSYSTSVILDAAITTDSSTWLRWTFMAESSQATGSTLTLIPDEYFPKCAVTVTPVLHGDAATGDTVSGAIFTNVYVLNSQDAPDQIVLTIGHSDLNSVSIPSGTEFLVTFTAIGDD